MSQCLHPISIFNSCCFISYFHCFPFSSQIPSWGYVQGLHHFSFIHITYWKYTTEGPGKGSDVNCQETFKGKLSPSSENSQPCRHCSSSLTSLWNMPQQQQCRLKTRFRYMPVSCISRASLRRIIKQASLIYDSTHSIIVLSSGILCPSFLFHQLILNARDSWSSLISILL